MANPGGTRIPNWIISPKLAHLFPTKSPSFAPTSSSQYVNFAGIKYSSFLSDHRDASIIDPIAEGSTSGELYIPGAEGVEAEKVS